MTSSHERRGVEIRTLDDSAAVRGAIEAHGRAWREAYNASLPQRVLDRVTVDPGRETVARWRDRFPGPDDPGTVYGASVGGQVRGYVFVRWAGTKPFVGPSEAGLKELYVHPDWWGGGLGTSLLGAATDTLPPGVDGVALEALADNEVGRSFYESRGFDPDGHGEIEIGDDSYKTIIYRQALAARE